MVGDATGDSVMSISQQKALGLEAANMLGWSGLSEHPAAAPARSPPVVDACAGTRQEGQLRPSKAIS